MVSETRQQRWYQLPRNAGLVRDIAAALLLLLFTAILAPIYVQSYEADAPVVAEGVVDFSGWDFSDRIAPLEGDWAFYWQADAAELAGRTPDYIRVPSLWSDVDPPYDPAGYAVYRLEIRGLPPGVYELHFPMIYAAGRVWLDGRLVSETGKTGKTAETTRTVFKPHSVYLYATGGTHEIMLETAAFHHRANGIEVTPVIGRANAVEASKQLLSTKDMFLHASLVILSLYGFTIFLFRREDKSALYFGLFCILAAVSMLVMGRNVIELVFPDIPLTLLLFILYVPFASGYAFFGLYFSALYPGESVRWLTRGFAGFYILMALSHVVLLINGQTVASSQIVKILSLSSIPFFLYVLSIILRAAIKGREGAGILLGGTLIFCVLLTNDMLVEGNVISRKDALFYGLGEFSIVVFLFTQVMILAGRWSSTLQRSERLAGDLSQLIDMSSAVASDETLPKLLSRIVFSGRRFLNAERGTLFLYDEDTDELWSLIAEGVTNREIRIPSTSGLAGACFQSGQIIRVNDAYNDARFLNVVDEQTGFQTYAILSVPVESKAGKRLGVLQMLNKTDRSPFDKADEYKLIAFASQAAISLENADLFGEISQARKYNDSILASMSNGVISINRNNLVEKVNRAAVAIWGGQENAYIGQNAVEILSRDNEWLARELASASGDGEARTFIDIDIRNYDGETKSVNLSIVPLSDEENEMGLLLLLEDITQEKRLKGTMSRFMTKEVAEKIMQEGSETLTGNAVTASVLFADMRNFTAMTEQLGAQETVSMLNEFFGQMTEEVFKARGVLDKFIGDSVMAVFGVPLEGEEDTDNALDCATGMMRTLKELNVARSERGEEAINLSIGIATGEAVAGTIGSAKRMEYTVVGDCVNLAARLENITRYYGVEIIASEDTLSGAGRPRQVRELDLIRVRGRSSPSAIYEVMDHLETGSDPDLAAMLEHYTRGLALYRGRDWAAAAEAFSEALQKVPGDRPSAIYLERSRIFSAEPPASDWDGIWTMGDKTG